jgi:hypothetical protein
MPIEMLFKYRYLLHVNNTRFNGELEIQTPAITATRSKEKFAPKRANNCRGERSLLTTGVNLWNSYLLGEEGRLRLFCGGWRPRCGGVVRFLSSRLRLWACPGDSSLRFPDNRMVAILVLD